MTENFPFLTDILSEPKGLQDVIDGYDPKLVSELSRRLLGGEFERVVLTGMGASTFGIYPAWLKLVQAGIPAIWMDTSELLAFAPRMVTSRTLLWMVSNSGESIEITRLLKRLDEFGNPFVLATTNDLNSPLAEKSNLAVPLYTGKDLTLATRSYIGTLAISQLLALNLAGKSVEGELDDLRYTAEGLKEYFDGYRVHLAELELLVGKVDRLAIVGRGPSYASALEGALCFKEGPKLNVEGISTGQFWHGPVELADASYTLLAMAGEGLMRKEDEFLAARAASLGMKVIWFSDRPSADLPTALLPRYRGIGLPMAEIVPLQLIAIHLGRQTGFRPGDFRHLTLAVSTKKEVFH